MSILTVNILVLLMETCSESHRNYKIKKSKKRYEKIMEKRRLELGQYERRQKLSDAQM